MKVIIYLKLCIHLKFENVNIENEGTSGKNFQIFEIFHFKTGKWMENELTFP